MSTLTTEKNIIIVFFIMYMFIFCAMYVYELIEIL